MAGKRLLDIAALFNASRGVARKHITLRRQQLDVFNKTSSLAKAVKSKSVQITETARVAASRLNETATSLTSNALQNGGKHSPDYEEKDSTVPDSGNFEAHGQESTASQEELLQDHFYEKSELNSSVETPAKSELNVMQEEEKCYPLPDGTIYSDGSNANKLKSYPRDVGQLLPERARQSLEQEHLQKEDVGWPPSSSRLNVSKLQGRATKLSSREAKILQRQSEQQIPKMPADVEEGSDVHKLAEGHDADSFYSPSIHVAPVMSSLPRFKIPRRTENSQGNDVNIHNSEINPDTFTSATLANTSLSIPLDIAMPEQDEVPEDVNTDLFYSPRVARLLGGRTQGSRISNSHLNGPGQTHTQQTLLAGGKTLAPSELSTRHSAAPDKLGDSSQISKFIADDLFVAPEVKPDVDLLIKKYEMHESRVPTSRISRLWNYGGLAIGMFGGTISESIRKATGSGGEGSSILSAGNMDRLVAKLSRMRGAALKLGQMMSFQDSKMLPAPIQEVLLRVQDSADYMPPSQRNKVLSANLGSDWRDLFETFDEIPVAAASIGQVHRAILKSSGESVAVKVQYPGVADSIDSDLSNLAILLTASRLLPKGLYLDKTIANARTELAWECDYIREAECGERFRNLLSDEQDVFVVPRIFPEASGKQVLTMEYMEGIGVTKVQTFSQDQRNWIGTQILRLCLREISEFRFMQTDPNWTNFLYNSKTRKLELLDFGASREYPEEFITKYIQLLLAASKSDKGTVRKLSIDLGYLTGHESKTMLNAHIASVMTLAEPFLVSSPETYDFSDQTITERVKALIPIMVRERLSPPPEETYSLHRKLSGAFLLCARLGSQVRCRELFENSISKSKLA